MVVEENSIYCPYCYKHTALSVANGLSDTEIRHQRIESIFLNNKGRWWIGVCNSCRNCVLVKETKNQNEEYEISDIFPQPLPKSIDVRVPDFIKKDVEEANKCLSVGAHKATCGLARLILQTICLDKGANENNLRDQINEIFEKRIITDEIKEWAHSVRYVGNDAFHPNKDSPHIEKEDAEDIMNLVEQMIHILYIAPAIAKEKQNKFK